MSKVKMSIIVACLNSEKTIETTILSIKKQEYDRLEVVIVDGGSTDATIDLIMKQNLKDIKIISEPDKGIGDAWNKGLKICNGDVIGILNSDDYYGDNILSGVSEYFSDVDSPQVGFGDVVLLNTKDGSHKIIFGKLRGKLGLLNGFGFLHPSVFFNRKALDRIGLFDTKIRVAVDTDWLLRAIFLKINFKKIPSLTFMRTGGVSDINRYTGTGEYADALVRNGYTEIYMIIFFMLRFLGKLRSVILWRAMR
jgi:glycosyltransferase involved in cell wall biosynthesis